MTPTGDFIPGSWATGSTVVMMLVSDMERVPKLPDDPIEYKHYTTHAPGAMPQAVQVVKAVARGMRPNMKFASNKQVTDDIT